MAANTTRKSLGLETKKAGLKLIPSLELADSKNKSDNLDAVNKESKKEMIRKNQPQAGKSLLSFLNALADSVDQEVEILSKL